MKFGLIWIDSINDTSGFQFLNFMNDLKCTIILLLGTIEWSALQLTDYMRIHKNKFAAVTKTKLIICMMFLP